MPDLHVILTLDSAWHEGRVLPARAVSGDVGRMHGKGRVFFTANGRPAGNWEE